MKLRDSRFASRHWRLAGHMVSRTVVLLPLGVGTLVLGMAIYHWVEGLGWPDAFLNAAMLLGGWGQSIRCERRRGSGWPDATPYSRAWCSSCWQE